MPSLASSFSSVGLCSQLVPAHDNCSFGVKQPQVMDPQPIKLPRSSPVSPTEISNSRKTSQCLHSSVISKPVWGRHRGSISYLTKSFNQAGTASVSGDRQTDRQTDTDPHRQTDRQTHTDRHRHRHTHAQTHMMLQMASVPQSQCT